MSETTPSFDEQLEQELRGGSARLIVWLAVAAGIGMALIQAIRILRNKRADSTG